MMSAMPPIQIDLTHPDLWNPVYLPLMGPEHIDKRYVIVYGSRGSGKSDYIAQEIVVELLNKPYAMIMLVRKVQASIKNSQFATIVAIIEAWGLSDYFKILYGNDPQIICKINGNKCICLGMDKPDKAKSIKDPTGAWYEEANQITEADFDNTTMSIRTNRKGVRLREWISFNPEQGDWIEERFFPKQEIYQREDGDFHYIKSTDPDTVILHTTYKDNRFLNPQSLKTYEKMKERQPQKYRVMGLGLWGAITEGLVFKDNLKGIVTPEQVPDNGEVIFGVDWGWNPDPSVLVKITKAGNRLYYEELVRQREMTKEQFIDKYLPLVIPQHQKHNFFYCDHQREELIEAAKNRMYNFEKAQKGPGSKNAGVEAMLEYDIYIVETPAYRTDPTDERYSIDLESGNLYEEFKYYSRVRNKEGKYTPLLQDGEDHGVDAGRMAVFTHSLKYWRAAEVSSIGVSSSGSSKRSERRNAENIRESRSGRGGRTRSRRAEKAGF